MDTWDLQHTTSVKWRSSEAGDALSEHLRMLDEMITQIRIDGDSEVKGSTRGDRDKF